jgi:hypothetical protein
VRRVHPHAEWTSACSRRWETARRGVSHQRLVASALLRVARFVLGRSGSAGQAGRNVEVIWLTGRLVPDHKTIADFRKDNGSAIRKVCARFVALCRELGLLTNASVAIDGSKFKAVGPIGAGNLAVDPQGPKLAIPSITTRRGLTWDWIRMRQ